MPFDVRPHNVTLNLFIYYTQTDTRADRQTDRQTDKETYRQAGTQAERDKLKTGRPTYRQKDRQVADQGRYPIVRGLVIDHGQAELPPDRETARQPIKVSNRLS